VGGVRVDSSGSAMIGSWGQLYLRLPAMRDSREVTWFESPAPACRAALRESSLLPTRRSFRVKWHGNIRYAASRKPRAISRHAPICRGVYPPPRPRAAWFPSQPYRRPRIQGFSQPGKIFRCPGEPRIPVLRPFEAVTAASGVPRHSTPAESSKHGGWEFFLFAMS